MICFRRNFSSHKKPFAVGFADGFLRGGKEGRQLAVSSEQLAVGVSWRQRHQTSDDQTSDACLAFAFHRADGRGPWTVCHKVLEGLKGLKLWSITFLPFPSLAFFYGLKRLDFVAQTLSSFSSRPLKAKHGKGRKRKKHNHQALSSLPLYVTNGKRKTDNG